MTRAALPEPRLWNARQVANRLGRSVPWFYTHHQALAAREGFPRKDPILKLWDSSAVEAWLNRRAGLEDNTSIENAMLEVVNGESHASLC